MAHIVLKDARVYLGGLDLSGHSNQVAMDYSAAVLPDTHFNSGGAETKVPGLLNVTAQVQGFVDLDLSDKPIFEKIGVADELLSLAASLVEGSAAYSFRANLANYSPGAQVGQLLAFSLQAEGTSKPLRGRLMLAGQKTDSGAGSPRQLGTVADGRSIHAVLHVLAIGGTNSTVDVALESDPTGDFDGSETTRITFDRMTQTGAQLKSAAGPIIDPWWRVTYTIGGTSPSVLLAVIVAIQ